MTPQDLDAVAREIIDANLYMTLGTADETGRPWVSPTATEHSVLDPSVRGVDHRTPVAPG